MCDLCENKASHKLPQQEGDDLAICDDCAVGRREDIVEGVYANDRIRPVEGEAAVEIEAGGREWQGTPEEFYELKKALSEVEFRG
jgi:hypothetical protein